MALNFIWATDSQNLVAFLQKGSPKWYIQLKVFEVYRLCKELNCSNEPLHFLRTDERIQQVDHLTKVRYTDKWSIGALNFEALHAQFQFEVDVFADKGNARLQCFITKNYEQGTYAVNAFSVKWPGMAWVCPPTSLLKRTAKRI